MNLVPVTHAWVARFVEHQLFCFEADFTPFDTPGFFWATGEYRSRFSHIAFTEEELCKTRSEALEGLFNRKCAQTIVKYKDLRKLEFQKNEIIKFHKDKK